MSKSGLELNETALMQTSFHTVHKLRSLLECPYAGLWECALIVWYLAKSENVPSIDNVSMAVGRIFPGRGQQWIFQG